MICLISSSKLGIDLDEILLYYYMRKRKEYTDKRKCQKNSNE